MSDGTGSHRLVAALRPDGRELVRLVRSETDPDQYASFQPITAGPVVAVAGLMLVGVLGILAAPIRLLKKSRSS
jgi:hypothetical protein